MTYLAIALVILLAAAFLFTRACTPAEDIEQESAIAELEPSNYELIDEAALQDILGAEDYVPNVGVRAVSLER